MIIAILMSVISLKAGQAAGAHEQPPGRQQEQDQPSIASSSSCGRVEGGGGRQDAAASSSGKPAPVLTRDAVTPMASNAVTTPPFVLELVSSQARVAKGALDEIQHSQRSGRLAMPIDLPNLPVCSPGKKTLVLDMDNTMTQLEEPMGSRSSSKTADFHIRYIDGGVERQGWGNARPWVCPFLENVQGLYDVVVFTTGLRPCDDAVASMPSSATGMVSSSPRDACIQSCATSMDSGTVLKVLAFLGVVPDSMDVAHDSRYKRPLNLNLPSP